MRGEMSTYLQLCQKITRDLGVGTSISTVSDQIEMSRKFVDWIADADEYVQSLYFDWKFLWSQYSTTTVVGTREYSAPSDLGVWDKDSFYLDYLSDDYIKLSEIPYLIWRQAFLPGSHTNSKPSSFLLAPNHNVYLEPIPDAAYMLTADYWKSPTRMTANVDTSDIPARFERIIIARAKIYYAEHEELPNVFDLATNEFDSLLKQLEAAELPGREEYGRGHAHDSDMVIRTE